MATQFLHQEFVRSGLAHYYTSSLEGAIAEAASKTAPATRIFVVNFLNSIGHGVEAHAEKIAKNVESLDELMLIRRTKLKKIEVPCKQRKIIMHYTKKYRQTLWQPKVLEFF
ncbi:hypothetical protein L7F22_042753 [Adiantum nelumboides]|nr:hypothetical protein [Adiantum nelumboides]